MIQFVGSIGVLLGLLFFFFFLILIRQVLVSEGSKKTYGGRFKPAVQLVVIGSGDWIGTRGNLYLIG